MKYTGQYIEDYLYEKLSDMDLPNTGGLYKRGTRPANSKKEDCVVAFISGSARQIQEGYVVVNIYVADIVSKDGMNYKDTRRCAELEEELTGLDSLLNQLGDIYFHADGMISTIAEPDMRQHFVSLKMKFRVLSDN